MNVTQQKFKPILFSTEMVQAILAGRKMQTRRVVNPQPIKFRTEFPIPVSDAIKDNKALIKKGYALLGTSGPLSGYTYGKSKYQPGDILWVRETFIDVGEKADQYFGGVRFHYKANQDFVGCWPWKPSIFMPKEAARIFLKVTNVRVERLQDISEEDAIAEGVLYERGVAYPHCGWFDFEIKLPVLSNPKNAFKSLWQSINGKKHPWDSNPWVWVYEFERIEKPENFN